jgi:hypothetical protein
MAEFVFLYRRAEQRSASPAQMQQTMQKWSAWFKELGDSGHLKLRGLPLERSGNMVGGTPKKNITDGPYAEKDLVIGFSLVEAKDLAHASELATSCPIFDDHGFVEVRPVMPMNL